MVTSSSRLKGRTTLAVDGFLEELEKEDLKKKTDLVELFSSFGVKLEKKGSSFMGLCPFHDDKNPSLSVDPAKGVYHCFGCGEGGDAIELVKKVKGVNFREAVAYLKTEAGLIRPLPREVKESRIHEVEPLVESSPTLLSSPGFILDRVAERYERNLAESAEARTYLESRGLWKAEILKRFHVGYSDGKLSDVLGEKDYTELEKLGIVKKDGREHFARSIVIPLYDEGTHVVSFYGRRIDADASSAKLTAAHLYLPGPHRGLMNREAAKVYRDNLVLTEAVLDALSLAALGVQNVIPCYGVNGFTEAHEKLMRDERVQKIILAFDADPAGEKGSQVLAERLLKQGYAVAIARPPRCKDWNEFLVQGGTKDEARASLDAALPFAAGGLPPAEGLSVAVATAKSDALSMTREAGRHSFTREGVRYRVAGARDSFQASLRVSIRVEALQAGGGSKNYVDTVDLYSARSRAAFGAAASSVGIESFLVERDLLTMLDLFEADRDKRLATAEGGEIELTEEEKAAGLELLGDPALCERIVQDLTDLGYVGEAMNKLLVYLAATSRKLDCPISVIVSSQSASGKSYLIDTVKSLMPPQDVVSMTSLSDQALNYLPEDGLTHKFLVMGEAVHAASVEHQIREMLSAHELSRLVTLKDEKTGELSSRLVRKSVVVALAMSTTRGEVNPENSSRCFVVSTDESEAQTKAVHAAQRAKYALRRHTDRENLAAEIRLRHRAAQRLLKPIAIVNPYAPLLDFPARMMRTRRDHERFLDLIAAVCFVRQFQKPPQSDDEGRAYLGCDLTDYQIAYGILKTILPSTLSSLPRAARALYEELRVLAREKAKEEALEATDVVLTQREIREKTGLSHFMVKEALRALTDYEYLSLVGSRVRGSRFGYRLVANESLALVDLTSIPTPEVLESRMREAGMDT